VKTGGREEAIGRERASESIVVADPAGTLTPCSQSPLYIFPGSCRVAVPSITWSYLTPSRSSRLTRSFARGPAARPTIAYLAERSRGILQFPSPSRPSYVFFPSTFPMAILLSVLPPPPIAVTRSTALRRLRPFIFPRTYVFLVSHRQGRKESNLQREMQNAVVNFDISARRRR
jgi:hypothetical protein